ncbi:MAG: serine O-acetyltransferase [Actinobacteria bacterium]|nr:serine O-acetyltransferase [Actinomycetota bacterium]
MSGDGKAHFLDDLRLALKRKGLGGMVRDVLLHPGNQAIALYRIYRWFYLKGWVTLAFLGYRLNYFLCGVEIHPDADIGPDFHLDHPISVLIGRGTRIGRGVRIYSHVAVGAVGLPEENPFMDIRDYVQIYHGAMVGGSAVIGEYAQIGLNAVVWNQDVPPYSVVVGNPGRVIKVEGRRVNPEDYVGYKYDPSHFHGPPPEHDPDKEPERSESWIDPRTYRKASPGSES